MPSSQTLSLSEYTQRISRMFVTAQDLQNVWITAETSDVRLSGGHCYLELVEKDSTGRPVAKMRANIWAQKFYYLAHKFQQATEQQLGSDMKIMVCGTAQYHQVFGLSFNITDIDPTYTLGDVMQKRMAILQKLQKDGTLEANRKLDWPKLPQRIAVISAPNAAGYEDFIKHLYTNRFKLRFVTRLFPATMQGERTVASVISALNQIYACSEDWDCVVIIRGGGSTSELLAFDDYELASNICEFPLPVVVGIGHQRDVTVLDYVASVSVKTPTAAADIFIKCGEQALGKMQSIAAAMLQSVTDRLGGCHQQLSYIAGQLPVAAVAAVERAKSRLSNAQMGLLTISDRRIRPEIMRLDAFVSNLRMALNMAISKERTRLDADSKLIEVLSPEATLKRGYSITRVNGHAVSSVAEIPPCAEIETQLADGMVISTISQKL